MGKKGRRAREMAQMLRVPVVIVKDPGISDPTIPKRMLIFQSDDDLVHLQIMLVFAFLNK